jgi:hypothetical protein
LFGIIIGKGEGKETTRITLDVTISLDPEEATG